MIQATLFEAPLPFGGSTYSKEHDEKRLTTQLAKVKEYMLSHSWTTLAQLQEAIGGSEAGLSARLRDLRKPWAGSYTVERRRVAGGLYEYRVRHAA